MTDKEIWKLAGNYGEWLNGEVIEINDVGVLEFARAIEEAQRNAIIKLCEEFGAWNSTAQDIADDIRMRGER